MHTGVKAPGPEVWNTVNVHRRRQTQGCGSGPEP